MRIAVTGAGGQLGRDLVPALWSRAHEPLPFTRSELDVTRPAHVRAALERTRPDAVIHAAAYTAVDQAEAEPERAFNVNREGTRHVAEACRAMGIPMVFLSTDYVFDGEKRSPYLPDDPARALNVYGASKLAGERCIRESGVAHLIVRTSWLYGAHGMNFVKTVLRLARDRGQLEVVDDQRGSPTWTGTLADALVELTASGAQGVLHVTDRPGDERGSPGVTWYEFARAVVAEAGVAAPLAPVSTAAFPRPARRPAYSVLDIEQTEERLGRTLPGWRGSLRRMLAELRSQRSGGAMGRVAAGGLGGREP